LREAKAERFLTFVPMLDQIHKLDRQLMGGAMLKNEL
jgi:hypothetical protein